MDLNLTKWTKPLHYKGRHDIGNGIERKLYGPNDMDEYFWPVSTTYDEETDMTTVNFALVIGE